MGIADRVEFLGYVKSVAPLLAALDVVVVPSLSEASGLIAIEALALGVPVVASRVGGLPEVIVDEETGLLVAPGRRSGDRVARLPDFWTTPYWPIPSPLPAHDGSLRGSPSTGWSKATYACTGSSSLDAGREPRRME